MPERQAWQVPETCQACRRTVGKGLDMGTGEWRGPARPELKAETPDDLRALIEQAERIVGNLRRAGARGATLLYLMDAIHEMMARLKDTGIDLRPEAARIETVERLLLAKDGVLVGHMRPLGGLAAAREAAKPAPGQWWWFLDAHVAERQRRSLRRALVVAGGACAVLLILWGLYHFVFPPDPLRVAVMEHTGKAEQMLMKEDLAGALAEYRAAAEIAPDDPEPLIWVGVLEEKLGHPQAAAAAFAQAEQASPDRARFLVARGMAWMRLGALNQAKVDAEAALAADAGSAEAYLLLGGVYEAEGKVREALDAFEQASTLAGEAGNSALVVMARTRMGMLMQSGPGLTGP